MVRRWFGTALVGAGYCLLAGCGLYVPDKSPIRSGAADISSHDQSSPQARYEDRLIRHINCELANGLVYSATAWTSPWLVSDKAGTTITLTITAEQQGGANAGASIMSPFRNDIRILPTTSGGNVVTPQSFSMGLGVTGAATSTRTETISWTQSNADILAYYKDHPNDHDCSQYQDGILIDSDLKIGEFIDDKMRLLRLNNLNSAYLPPKRYVAKYHDDISQVPIFSTFTEDLNFISAFGGTANPTWKLVSVTANSPGNLLAAENTYTNDLVITIGLLKEGTYPYALQTDAQAQHQTRVNASAIATSIQSQSHQ